MADEGKQKKYLTTNATPASHAPANGNATFIDDNKPTKPDFEFEEIIEVYPPPTDLIPAVPSHHTTLLPDEREVPLQSKYGTLDGHNSPIVENLEEQVEVVEAEEDGDSPQRPLDAAGIVEVQKEEEGKGKRENNTANHKPSRSPIRPPVEDVTSLVADDVGIHTRAVHDDVCEDFSLDDLIGELEWGKSLSKEVREQQQRMRKIKRKDPAVVVEIPKSPSADAYEVAHKNKLDDKFFEPLYEDTNVDELGVIEIENDVTYGNKKAGDASRIELAEAPPTHTTAVNAPPVSSAA